MFIERVKKKYKVNEPIFTKEILELFNEFSRAYVFRLIRKAIKKGELVKFNNGVYFIPKNTNLGSSTILADDVVEKKYLQNGNAIFGVCAGLALQNSFLMTTQVPFTIEIVTNNESTRRRKIEIDGRRFILRKSRLPITKENEGAYTIIQLFYELGTKTKLNRWAKKLVINYINEKSISSKDLLEVAASFPSRAIKGLITSGLLNEIA